MALPRPTHRSLAVRTLGALVAAGFALSACGSSAPSRQSYASKAGAICTSVNDQASKVTGLSSSNPQTVANALGQELTILEKGQSQLNALTKPSGDNTSLNQALSDIDKAVTDLKTVQSDVQSSTANETTIKNDIAAYQNDTSGIDTAFGAAGIPKCAQKASTGT